MIRKSKIVLIFSLLTFSFTKSFTQLDFSVPIVSCEEKWIVCPMIKDSSYQFGFVFPTTGGITFRLVGAFIIAPNGEFVRLPDYKVNQTVELAGGEALVSLLPEQKRIEMELGQYPPWYDKETNVSGSIVEIFTKGVVFNLKGEYDKAVIFLEQAYKMNPEYTNVRFQLAKAYNGVNAYDKAIPLLNDAIKLSSYNYELYQELSYAKLRSGDIVGAEEAANRGIKLCDLNPSKCQMAINIAIYYFEKKDAAKFNDWIKIAQKYSIEGGRYTKQIHSMIDEASKW